MSIYRVTDAKLHLTYAGGADVKYIPVGEKVELNLGEEPRVSVAPKRMDFPWNAGTIRKVTESK